MPLNSSIIMGVLYMTTEYIASCATMEASSMAINDALCCHNLGIVSDDEAEEE